MAILFADSFNSYVSGAVLTGGSVNAIDGLLRAGYEQPFSLPVVSGFAAGAFTTGGKQNNGAAARICWQTANSNSALNYDPPLDAVGLKRVFSFHWERFICLSSQIRLTRYLTAPVVATKIPVIVFGPVTVYASQTTVNGVAVYKLYANNSAQIGQIDSGSWPSIDIEINREQKKLRVWLANLKIWEADSDYFTTTSFEYVGMVRKPNGDNIAVHVGTIDVDSVVIFDGSGTTNNERIISLAAKTFAADQVVETGFGFIGNGNPLTSLSSAFLLNDSLDTRYQTTTLPHARDLIKLSSTDDSPPMGVSVTTVFKSIEADSLPIKFAYQFNADPIAYRTPFLQAGGWRQRKVILNSAPDGTDWAPAKVPQLAWGYEVSDTKEYAPLVNGAFDYLVFGAVDLFDMYRGDPDPTYVDPVKPEYVIPQVTIEDSGPGIKTLKAGGTRQLGYFGVVSSDLVFPDQTLSAMFPLTEGTELNASPDWLKFVNGGQVLFVAKTPMRKDISWQTLYTAGLVYGVDGSGLSPLPVGSPVNQLKIVKSGGFKYRLRMIQGADTNPSVNLNNATEAAGFKNSEYSRLFLRCSVSDPTSTFWEKFSDTELGRTDGANTNLTWCKESHPLSASHRVSRGAPDITGITASVGTVADSGNNLKNCWRPVLEYIGIDADYVPPSKTVTVDWTSEGKGIAGTYPIGNQRVVYIASDNKLFLTMQPLTYLTSALEIKTLPAGGFSSTSPVFAALTDSVFVGNRAYSGDYRVTSNGGQTWKSYTPTDGTSSAGEAFLFKGSPIIKHTTSTTNSVVRKFTNLSMGAYTDYPVAVPYLLNSGTFALNENVVVSASGGSTFKSLYISWDGISYTGYDVGNTYAGTPIVYAGYNVFLVVDQLATLGKLVYVPPTKGAPTVLGTIPNTPFAVLQFKSKLLVIYATKIYESNKVKRLDDFNATLSEARAHFDDIVKTLTNKPTDMPTINRVIPWFAQDKLMLASGVSSMTLWNVSKQ